MDEYIRKQNAIDLWHKFQPYIAVKAMEYDNALAKLPSAEPEQQVDSGDGETARRRIRAY